MKTYDERRRDLSVFKRLIEEYVGKPLSLCTGDEINNAASALSASARPQPAGGV